MASILILSTPPGEAPESIRRAWVGLSLPLVEGLQDEVRTQTVGVVSRKAATSFLDRLIGRKGQAGYVVDAPAAIAVLSEAHPEAAAWWRQNVPDTILKGNTLVFPRKVCRKEA